MSGSASRRCHCAVALEGRIASETSTSRPCGAGSPRISTSPRLMPKRSSSACIANCGWFDAGCAVNLPSAFADAADQLPGVVVEIGIEPRQHHRALRQAGDGMQQSRGRRHRSGRARRDHRTVVMRGQARGFGLDQQIAPRRRLDPVDARRASSGHAVLRDVEELQRELPVLVERIRHQPVERAPRRPCGSPCRPSAAPDRRPAPASRPARRSPAAPVPRPPA